ncbi:ComEC/Rec2 family competence protein [Carboxylicivirga taeanensis]|uniref:ComEC/Rec2 family competence protein n=1 Tax=Carboxylicivirga taeanensis TaxID=1416875 RepID=UPI003F6DDF0C
MLSMLNLFLRKAPFVRIVIPIIIGIYSAYKLPSSVYASAIVCITLFVSFSAIVFWQHKVGTYRYRFFSGFIGFIMLFAFAVLYFQLRKPSSIDSDSSTGIQVQVIQFIGETDKNHKYEVFLKGVACDSLLSYVDGKGIIYIPKEEPSTKHNTGDELYLSGHFIPFLKPDTRFDFDYSTYLRNQRIVFRYLVQGLDVVDVEPAYLHPTLLSVKLKNYLRNSYLNGGLSDAQLAILNALFLGDKSLLSYEQKSAFSKAGAMHLLAVSGLHVGIIYMLLLGVASLVRLKRKKVLMAVFVIACLWFYAGVTGFSPSVLRASLMFTILEFGRISNKQTGIFNLLGASMFIIILIEPLSVFNIGFWLSHVAVASIVMFYPKINNWVHFQFPPFRWMWSIIAVSLAAQIGTLPISIYAFHQFPVYFMLANVLLIPLVTPILLLALLGALLSFSSFCLQLILPALSSLLGLMEEVTLWIESLPFSIINNLYVAWWQLPMCYGAIVLLLVYINYRFLNHLKYALWAFIIVGSSFHVRKLFIPDEVVYVAKVSNKSVVNYIGPDANVVYSDADLTEKEVSFAFSGLWAYCNAKSAHIASKTNDKLNSLPVVYLVGGESLVILPKGAHWPDTLRATPVNYLVLMGQPAMSFKNLKQTMPAKHIILPSGWKWYQKKWLGEERDSVDNVHVVSKDGAYLMALSRN